jgi:vancomycin resistance protein YoaR
VRETTRRGGKFAALREHQRRPAPATKQGWGGTPNYARRRKNAGIALLAGVLLVVIAVWFWEDAREIRQGIRVGEVDVGGMTRAEAREAVERHAASAFEEIRFGEGVFSVPGEKLGVKVDAASAVREAYSVGREGWAGKRVYDVLRAYFLGGIRIDSDVEYREEAARTVLEDVGREFYEKPQDATFRVTDDGQVEVQKARQGRILDQRVTLSNLDRALTEMRSEVPIAANYRKPEISTEEVEGLKPTKVIGEYRTDFRWDSNPSRKANMKLAAGAINNTLVAPGEVFSFNELTSKLDYASAKTFSDGGVAYADGGGLCQVSSTLYMAAQYAGLKIVERHPHYAVLPYIKPGFDATVWFGDEGGWGVLDMKFKNTTDAYVLVREWVDEKGFLNAEIIGQPTGKKVKMRTVKIFERPQVGIKWATYKTVTNNDGKVLFDGLIHDYIYAYNPPAPEGGPHYDTSIPRVSGWKDPTNTTGWASPH